MTKLRNGMSVKAKYQGRFLKATITKAVPTDRDVDGTGSFPRVKRGCRRVEFNDGTWLDVPREDIKAA